MMMIFFYHYYHHHHHHHQHHILIIIHLLLLLLLLLRMFRFLLFCFSPPQLNWRLLMLLMLLMLLVLLGLLGLWFIWVMQLLFGWLISVGWFFFCRVLPIAAARWAAIPFFLCFFWFAFRRFEAVDADRCRESDQQQKIKKIYINGTRPWIPRTGEIPKTDILKNLEEFGRIPGGGSSV